MAGQQITGLTVEGYKSFGKKQHLQIRPLTLLAGANSSGKSSVIQPLLLLKQTLDAPFDPGPLKIDGPNVAFSWNTQMFTQNQDGKASPNLRIGLEYPYREQFFGKTSQRTVELEFQNTPGRSIALTQERIREIFSQNGQELCNEIILTEGKIAMSTVQDNAWLSDFLNSGFTPLSKPENMKPSVVRTRCFLDLVISLFDNTPSSILPGGSFSHQLSPLLSNIIYIPGLRDPASVRSYPLMSLTERFPGPMHPYLASVIYHWGRPSDSLDALEQDLRTLGLAEKVAVEAVDDTALEVLVGRHHSGTRQTASSSVSLADVGLGLSQVMPVLAALRVAHTHHLVVIEQPELHLHPRGVYKLASIIVDAVNRGVKIVMETHSELLLLGIQTMVAEGHLDPGQVILNWFSLDKQGHSCIHQAEIEQDGSFGDWPVDFLDVELSAQMQYLDAASSHG